MITQKIVPIAIAAIALIGLLLMQMTAGVLTAAQAISSKGIVTTLNTNTMAITPSNVIGTNNLTLGTQLTYGDLEQFSADKQAQKLMQDAGIKLAKFLDSELDKTGNPLVLGWNETSHTGSYNWTVVDQAVQTILDTGAQPLIVLLASMTNSGLTGMPLFINGMESDAAMGGLPSPADAASYCATWVTHMNAKGYAVKYYAIGNEIQSWLFNNTMWTTLSGPSLIHMEEFAAIYNAAVTAMKQVNSALSVSFDFSWFSGVMSWWLANYTGIALDRLDFHNYASNYVGEYTESQLIQMAQTITNTNGGTGFWSSLIAGSASNPIAARESYFNTKGVMLPLFDTESNLDAGWMPNTDPKIVQMVGAVFTALLLKTEILENVNAHIYFDWDASLSYQKSLSPPSYGFGLINSDNDQPWYPYYTYQMIGSNLQVGDPIVSSTNFDEVSSFAWVDKGNINILLINTFNGTTSTIIGGVGGNFNFEKIDDTYSFLNAQLQKGSLTLPSLITMNGYTVMLLTSTPTPQIS